MIVRLIHSSINEELDQTSKIDEAAAKKRVTTLFCRFVSFVEGRQDRLARGEADQCEHETALTQEEVSTCKVAPDQVGEEHHSWVAYDHGSCSVTRHSRPLLN